LAGGQLVGHDTTVLPSAAVLLPAELRDAEAVHDDRRTGREKLGPVAFEIVFAPEVLPAVGLGTGEGPADAEGHDLAVGHGGRASRADDLVVETRPGPRRGLRGVLVLPDLLPVGRLETADDLVAALAGEDVHLVADHGGRGDAAAHRDLPLLGQLLGP